MITTNVTRGQSEKHELLNKEKKNKKKHNYVDTLEEKLRK